MSCWGCEAVGWSPPKRCGSQAAAPLSSLAGHRLHQTKKVVTYPPCHWPGPTGPTGPRGQRQGGGHVRPNGQVGEQRHACFKKCPFFLLSAPLAPLKIPLFSGGPFKNVWPKGPEGPIAGGAMFGKRAGGANGSGGGGQRHGGG